MILGLALANALPGVLIAAMDPGRVESSPCRETGLPARRPARAGGGGKNCSPPRRTSPPRSKRTVRDSGWTASIPPTACWRASGGASVLTVKGALYDKLREETTAAAVRSLIPEGLRDKYTPVTRKAWYGAEFPRRRAGRGGAGPCPRNGARAAAQFHGPRGRGHRRGPAGRHHLPHRHGGADGRAGAAGRRRQNPRCVRHRAGNPGPRFSCVTIFPKAAGCFPRIAPVWRRPPHARRCAATSSCSVKTAPPAPWCFPRRCAPT